MLFWLKKAVERQAMHKTWIPLVVSAIFGGPITAQEFNDQSLDFQGQTLEFKGVNSFIDRYSNRELIPGSMSDQLSELRHRVLADPFPIPETIRGGSLFEMAIDVAKQYNIPEQLFFNLVTAESNWDVDITSHRGAIGLTQLMPGTADELGVNPWDAMENLEGGARYLSQQYSAFGSWELALAAYNAGPGAVRKYDGIPPYEETEEYVEKIMTNWENGAAPPTAAFDNIID